MRKLLELIRSKPPESFPEYQNLYKKIQAQIAGRDPEQAKPVKIAVLTSFTSNGFKEVLTVKCCDHSILPEMYIAPYNQYNQEILNPKSGLYAFRPDLIILFIDARSLLDTRFHTPYELSADERRGWSESCTRDLISLVNILKQNSTAKILLHNLEVPVYSPLGVLENKQKFGYFESVESVNTTIRDTFRADSQVFVFDYNAFLAKWGKDGSLNYKLYYIADLKLNLDYLPRLAEEYLAYIKPMLSLSRKCIVLDLDNTLWGGVIGEDGIEGIRLGPTPEGRPYWEFQKYLLSLFHRGIILAINSKNNPEDALSAIRDHPNMVLREEHFAAIRINWQDKITNMVEIAKELNIGLDSIVFIDDDKLNREMISEGLPEVQVIDLPEDSSLYLQTLCEIRDFNTLQVTKEDLNKGKMYAEQRQRDEFQKSATDVSHYLRGLGMTVTIEKATPFTIPRISQLTQKTNQFNMTTRRYLEEDIRKFSEDPERLVISVDVKDKFGENGITGVIIVKTGSDIWYIDSFLLSCRIIGRQVEEALLAYLIGEAKKRGAKRIGGEFIPTKKNQPARDFYRLNGFSLKSTVSEREMWEFDLAGSYQAPDYIRVIVR